MKTNKEFLDKEVHLWDEHKWYVEQRKKMKVIHKGKLTQKYQLAFAAYSYGWDAALQHVVTQFDFDLDKGNVLKQEAN